MSLLPIVSIYFLVINIIGFLSMGIDKWKSRRQAWRIAESTLFLISIAGGSAGSIMGMYVFHHKTLHRKFTLGLPIILFLQIVIGILIYFYLPFTFKIM